MNLTGRGWVLAAFAPVAGAAGALFGIEELYLLAAAAVVLVVLAAVWVACQHCELDSSRRLRPAYLPAGEAAGVELTVANRARRRSPLLAAQDPLGHGDAAAFRLAPLRPGEAVTGSYGLPPLPRGRYLVGPLRLTATDPFELVRRRLAGAPAALLTVHPAIALVEPSPAAARSDGFGGQGSGPVGPAGEELTSLRAYVEGDDLRLVHWPSTARLDQVIVRQTDGMAEPRCTVAVDLRAGMWTPALLEEALAAAAGLLEAARRAKVAVRLLTASAVTAGTLDTGFGTSDAHWGRALDALAGAQPGAGGTTARRATLGGLAKEAARGAGLAPGDTVVVVTSSRAEGADWRALAGLATPGSLILVAFAVPGDTPAGRTTPPGHLVWVAEGQDFAAAWATRAAVPTRPEWR